ncbi:MAG: plasmid stabilization protein [Gemmatimonadota bacterium]|nr:plasmid stabilization protein [Gemmatimonadota bacterium]
MPGLKSKKNDDLTIRNFGVDLTRHLRVRAGEPGPPADLARAIRARFAPLGGVELQIPPRDPMREPPGSTFSEAP